jgi:High-temperature-induced dauer-formation protein
MGASDSKLVFKQGIFKLSEQKDIPANDEYWTGVCGPPLPVCDLLD